MSDIYEHIYLSLFKGQAAWFEETCDKVPGKEDDNASVDVVADASDVAVVEDPSQNGALKALVGPDGQALTQTTEIINKGGFIEVSSDLHFLDAQDERMTPFKEACLSKNIKQLDKLLNLDMKNAIELLKLTSESEKIPFSLEVHKDDLTLVTGIFQDFIKTKEDGKLDIRKPIDPRQKHFSILALEFDVKPTPEQLFAFHKYSQWITKESKSTDETVIAQTENRGANYATLYHIAQKQLENSFQGLGTAFATKSYFDPSDPESLMSVSAERFVSYAENTTIKKDLEGSWTEHSYYKYVLLNYEDGASAEVNQAKPVEYAVLAKLAEKYGQVFADAISHFQNNVALSERTFTHEEKSYKAEGFMEPISGFVEVKIYVDGNEVPIELEFDKKDSGATVVSRLPEGAEISETALRLVFLYFREYLVSLGTETGSKLETFDQMIVI